MMLSWHSLIGLVLGALVLLGKFSLATVDDDDTSSGYTLVWEEDGIELYRLEEDLVVNSYVSGDQSVPRAKELLSGGFVVTWMDVSSRFDYQGRIRFQIFDDIYNKVGEERAADTSSVGVHEYPSIATLISGDFVIVWTSDQDGTYDIYGQRFDSSGNKLGDEFRINTYTTSTQDVNNIAALMSGGFVVTWDSFGQDGSNKGVFAQIFDEDGNAVGSEFQVDTQSTDYQGLSNVAGLLSGDFVIVWDRDSGIYAQIFQSDGTRVGEIFEVTLTSAYVPTVVGLTTGGFAVTWSGYGYVSVQLFDSVGQKIGDTFQANSTTAGNIYPFPSISALPTGFVITWHSYLLTGEFAVYAQVFENDGSKVGPEFQVSESPPIVQNAANAAGFLTGTWAGGFAITWADSSNVAGQVFLVGDGNITFPTSSTTTQSETTTNSASTTEAASGEKGMSMNIMVGILLLLSLFMNV